MHIRYGFAIDLACETATPLIAILDVHPSQRGEITVPDAVRCTSLATGEPLEMTNHYLDKHENICRRVTAPAGGISLRAEGVIHNSGFPESQPIGLPQTAPDLLPPETLPFLLGSQYCEVDKVSARAWQMFGNIESGQPRVQAVCDFVHGTVRFGYEHARGNRTASEVLNEGVGVCRDFAHLAITLCRALNIPARYCTGYLGDIGVAQQPDPMDFSAWFEVFLDGRWWPFDARHNTPRIGRILIARGMDSTDCPLIHSFGAHTLSRFEVFTEELAGSRFPVSASERRNHHERLASVGDRSPATGN
ncbi:MAG: transglutaminase-like domain-containing protein [Beijerinckiaceae bacterium]